MSKDINKDIILAPLDAANLLSHGLLTPGLTPGTQRLHKRRLNRSSDEEHSNLALQIPAESLDTSDAFVTIPTSLFSRETLTHIGLTEAKSAKLWDIWDKWPEFGRRSGTDDIEDGGLEIEFIEIIRGGLENHINAAEDDDGQWRACLDACGVTAELQDAIMDPHFKYIRLSASCLYWVRDAVEMRYAGLEEIQRSSRERERDLQRMAAGPSEHQGGDETGGGQRDTHTSTHSRIASQGPRPVSGFQQQSAPGIETATWRSATAIAASKAPGHTVLFKVRDQGHIGGYLFDPDRGRVFGLFDDAGSLNHLQALLSTIPSDFSTIQSDFNATRATYYFTPDRENAEFFAAYAKRGASNCDSVVIVCLRIPNAAIDGLPPPDIQHVHWPSPEWKELVWLSRSGRYLPSRVRHLRKYHRDAVLVIGTTARKPNSAYRALKSWEALTDEYVLRVGRSRKGEPAVQYAFSGETEGYEFLMEHGQDIRAFPCLQSELEAWLAENE